jgi:glutamate synthase (NADPH/NADH) small chain
VVEGSSRPKVDRKARFQIPAQVMPKQDPKERVHNWNEAYLPLDPETAKIEARRCIQCPAAPCTRVCPVHNDIPAAFWLLEQGDIVGAANKFRETSNLPEMCGRLCPQERLCEGDCVIGKRSRPVAIGRLEVFVADYQRNNFGFPMPELPPPTGKKVALVGAGPASMGAAEELVKKGHAATIFDAWPEPGGVLLYGIPSFKMEKHVLDDKIEFLKKLGVQFVQNTFVGRDITVADLVEEGYQAIFLGHGASQGVSLGIPGSDLAEVYMATDFLVRGNLTADQLPEGQGEPIKIGRRVAIIGGGDTAMDCVRTSVRLRAETVTCVYRRTEAEMPGRGDERVHAKEEGVQFEFLTAPLRFIGDENGRVKAIECQRQELGEPDDSGRRRPVPIEGSEFIVEADTVVLALGYRVDPIIEETTPGLEAHRDHRIRVDDGGGATSRIGVFAGGDCVNGADLVVTALADGRRGAAAIDEYLRSLPAGAPAK